MSFSNTSDRRRRGTIIVLVVAVLALLAVIGTVYIISARAEKSAASATATGVNLYLARSAIMNSAVTIIGDEVYDRAGRPGGSEYSAGAYGTLAGRRYTYPECGDPATMHLSIHDANVRSQPWLAKWLHVRTGGGPEARGDFGSVTRVSDFTRLLALNTLTNTYQEAFFNPSTGFYDLPLTAFFPTPGDTAPPYKFNVVRDMTQTDNHDVNGQGSGGDAANPDAGTLTETSYPDSYVWLLPWSEASGIRYRYGLRIIDTSGKLNLNVGDVGDPAAAPIDPLGTYLTSIKLTGYSNMPGYGVPLGSVNSAASSVYSYLDQNAGNANKLHMSLNNTGVGRAGFASVNAAFTPANWQQAIFRIEKPQDGPTGAFNLALYGASEELELRAYGEFGTKFPLRPGLGNPADLTQWPNTLWNMNPASPYDVIGNPRRRAYTAYSFTRLLRPAELTFEPFTLTPLNGAAPANFPGFGNPSISTKVWPAMPARVAANPDVKAMSSNDADQMFYLAMAATNLATAMKAAGYTQEEALSFAANYVAHRTSVMQGDTTLGYQLPLGPSFIDDQGIHIRTANSAGANVVRDFGSATDTVATAGKVYLGYAAQPWINEVAANVEKVTDPVTGVETVTVKDTAIELYNPYKQPLNLAGFQIKIDSGAAIQLTGMIPAQGYYVIYDGSGSLAGKINAAAQKQQSTPLLVSNAGGKVTLNRLYTDKAQTTQYAPVDQFDYTGLVPAATDAEFGSGTNIDVTMERKSGGSADIPRLDPARWGTAVNIAETRTTAPSLGLVNAATGNVGMELWDRSCENAWVAANADSVHGPFENIGRFNRVMRVAHVFTTDGATIVPLSEKLRQLIVTTPAPYSNFTRFTLEPYESQIHFNFYPDPTAFSTTPDATKSDLFAIKFLDFISMIDRVSDPSIDLLGQPGNASKLDINKIRLPGLINVNTAYPDVLRCLPGLQAITVGTNIGPDQVVGNIINYRSRGGPSNGISSGAYPGNGYAVATYPGRGIRSMAELLIPVSQGAGTNYETLDARDAAWASIFNQCTVRSDTFVVYGYLEAVKANTRLAGGHNNSTDWYDTASTSDDQNNSTMKNIRLARMRWVAIVDRSFCNYEVGNSLFQLPRIVAIKDLPK